jgi:hypothetical protein
MFLAVILAGQQRVEKIGFVGSNGGIGVMGIQWRPGPRLFVAVLLFVIIKGAGGLGSFAVVQYQRELVIEKARMNRFRRCGTKGTTTEQALN